MKYALNLAEDNRILSACVVLPNGNYGSMPIVDIFPDGDITDYIYINGEFIYDPIPKVEVKLEPTAQDDTDAMMVDHELRITMLELNLV